MSRGNKGKSVYVDLSHEQSSKLSILAFVLPPKKDGTKLHKKDLVRIAVEQYLDRLFELFEGSTDVMDMIKKAKEIDIEDVVSNTLDLPQKDAGFSEF